MTKVVCMVGKKKSGKTTFIEKLVPALARLGVSVGTVKHDAHSFDMDHEGKDSWRHRKCGAETVVVSSPAQVAVIRSVEREMPLEQIVDTYFRDRHLVIAEGYFRSDFPKMEIFRPEAHDLPLCTRSNAGEKQLLAMITDEPTDVGVPTFSPDDAEGAAQWLARHLLGWVASGMWSGEK